MFNEKNDSFLLYMNSKAVAIGPDFATVAELGQSVAKDRPEAALTIRVADRLSEFLKPAVDGNARTWAFEGATLTWREIT